MKKKSYSRLVAVTSSMLLVMFFLPLAAYAHFPWINLTDYTPDKGAGLSLTIGWGHRYPLDGFLKESALEDIVLIGPGKTTPKIIYTSEVELQSERSLSLEGTYIIAAQRKAGFYTKTARGGKAKSKKGLDDVIRCSYSYMCMKAVANVGKGTQIDTVVGHPIEIIPLQNPVNLRAGDYLPIRVLLKGQPYRGEVLATYVGFSTDKNTFAYVTTTDKKGHARIRILQQGIWMIKVAHQLPFPDPQECDVQSYIGTLTLKVE
ncbi:MAG: DUF4198 domain-containing protein [Desulfobacteraceae bacterium]|jgi:uncharacterized GH25 family protein